MQQPVVVSMDQQPVWTQEILDIWVKHLPAAGSKQGGITLAIAKGPSGFSVGAAVCSRDDTYNHATGAHLAMLRARQAAANGEPWRGPQGREREARRAMRQHLPVKILWG